MKSDERARRIIELEREELRLGNFATLTKSQEDRLIAVRDEMHRLHIDHVREIVASGEARTEAGTPFTDRAANARDRSPQALTRAAQMWEPTRSESPVVAWSPTTAAELKARAFRVLDAVGGNTLPPAARANPSGVQRIVEAIESDTDPECKLARWAVAASDPAYMSAFCKLARDPQRGHLMFDGDELAAWRATNTAARAMSLTDSAGGYLVPFQLDTNVIIAANGATNPIRAIARKVIATGDVWNGVSAAAVSWSWDAEASQVSDDAPTFTQPTIPIYMARGFVPVSIEAFEDMANGGQEVAKLLTFGRDVLEASTLAVGSGVGQPTGIVTDLVGTSSVVTSAAADTFALGDIYATFNALPARFRANASWVMNGPVINLIRRFGEGTTGPQEDLVKPPTVAGAVGTLLGRPVYDSDQMDGVINAAAENYVAVFGDFSNYVIADRIGMTVELVPHLFGTANGRPTGQRGWFAYYRSGAASVQDGAFRLLNVT